MKIEVGFKNDTCEILYGVKKIEHRAGDGYYFLGEDGELVMFVPSDNLVYYQQR